MAFARGTPALLAELETRLVALEAAAPKSAFLSGSGAPAPGLGQNGDHYLNSDNGELSKKAAGAWAFLGQVWFDTTP